ncbi:MAG: hypothetical protein HZA06_02185 [Nitrospirae bacterium]|nr:hypothetical protein [Nitrospirota bacterium]
MLTEVKITSHRPVIGWFVVAYKKLIKLIIAPYLKNVLNHTEARLEKTEARLNEVNEICNELIKRMDSTAVILNQRVETLRYRFEYYIDTEDTGTRSADKR